MRGCVGFLSKCIKMHERFAKDAKECMCMCVLVVVLLVTKPT